MNMTVVPILLCIFMGLMIYFFPKYHKVLTILTQFFVLLSVVYIYISFRMLGTFYHDIGGYGIFGIRHKVDELSSSFILLTVIIYTICLLYDSNRKLYVRIFKMLFFITQGLLIGIFLSNDIFNIYVLMEFSTVLISILIMFHKDGRSVYDGLMYLMINLVGMSFFLLGIGFVYKVTGSLDLDVIHQEMQSIPIKALILPYGLLMTGIALKSALLPVLFTWLPKAHGTKSAPSIITAVLSGVFVKTGVFLFIRLQEMFMGRIEMQEFFLILGAFTALGGIVLALAQRDIKLILAYSTVSQIGLIMMGINSSYIGYVGGLYHIINHGLFKSLLFLGAGNVIHYYHESDIYKIRGVLQRMPRVGWMMIAGMLAVTGAPLLNGSISKALISKDLYGITYTLFYLINIGTILYYLKLSYIFLPQTVILPKITVGQNKIAAMLILTILCFLGGFFPQIFIHTLLASSVTLNFQILYKLIEYIGMLLLGGALYYFVFKKFNWIEKLNKKHLSFNHAVMMITVFFFILVAYMSLSLV